MDLFPLPFGGLIHVTGEKGVGKTFFAFSAAHDPKKVAFLDLERSGAQVHLQVGFGVYRDLLGEMGILEPEHVLFRKFTSIVDQLPENQFDVLVVDNVAPLESAIDAYIMANPKEFRLTRSQLERAPALKWGPYKNLYRQVLTRLQRKAKLVVVTSHLKAVWAGSQPVPGLFRPQGKDVLTQQASLAIWLLRTPNWPPPAGLVLYSRMSRIVYGPRGPETRAVLPMRLPQATWNAIREYMEHPFDPEHPRPDEVPSENEWHLLRGTLTREQLEFMKLALRAASRNERPESSQPSEPEPEVADLQTFVKRILAAGLTLPSALEKLGVQSLAEVEDFEEALATLGI